VPRRSPYRPWAELLKRTFGFDVLACPRCERGMRLLAMVTEPKSIARYLRGLGEPTEAPTRAPARGPPYRPTIDCHLHLHTDRASKLSSDCERLRATATGVPIFEGPRTCGASQRSRRAERRAPASCRCDTRRTDRRCVPRLDTRRACASLLAGRDAGVSLHLDVLQSASARGRRSAPRRRSAARPRSAPRTRCARRRPGSARMPRRRRRSIAGAFSSRRCGGCPDVRCTGPTGTRARARACEGGAFARALGDARETARRAALLRRGASGGAAYDGTGAGAAAEERSRARGGHDPR
jgi:hypothetical protein